MLLAIADFADDDGNAYPSVAKLAKKCRMGSRNANMILAQLRASGELEVRINEGPKGTNRYRVTLKRVSPLKSSSPLKQASATPEAGFPVPLKPASDEPSLNRQEPSGRSLLPSGEADDATRGAKLPKCPYTQIVALYHDALPELPRAVVLDAKGRKQKLNTFWAWVLTSVRSDGHRRATTTDEALAWITSYFSRARSNDFIMGRSGRSAGHENWEAGLDYLMTERGRLQVIERTRAATA